MATEKPLDASPPPVETEAPLPIELPATPADEAALPRSNNLLADKADGMDLANLRVRFGGSVGNSYWIFAIAIPVLVVALMALLSGLIPGTETIDKLALAASLQVGLGMYLGFMSMYFGVMMTWLGIEASFNLAAEGKAGANEVKTTFTSASPGLLFGLMGGVLVVASLYKTIEFKVKDNSARSPHDVIDKDTHTRKGPADGIVPPPPETLREMPKGK